MELLILGEIYAFQKKGLPVLPRQHLAQRTESQTKHAHNFPVNFPGQKGKPER